MFRSLYLPLRHFCYTRFCTILAVGLGLLVVLSVPQVSHVLSHQLPTPWQVNPGERLVAILLWVFVVLLFTWYLASAVLVIPHAHDTVWRHLRIVLAAEALAWGLLYVEPISALLGGFPEWLIELGAVAVFFGYVGRVLGPTPAPLEPPADRALPGANAPLVPPRWEAAYPVTSALLVVAQFPVWLTELAAASGWRTVLRGLSWAALFLALLWIGLAVGFDLWDRPAHAGVPYGLSQELSVPMGGVLAALAIWLLCAVPRTPPGAAFRCTFRATLFGRALAFLTVAILLGELLWWLPRWAPGAFSNRNFTVWAIFHLLFVVIIAARILDALHVYSRSPVRPLLPLAFAGLIVLAPLAIWLNWDGTTAVGRQLSEAEWNELCRQRQQPVGADWLTDQWFDCLEARLRSIPKGQPVLVVAASGGGSRAALYTALVLEALRQTEVSLPGNVKTTLDRHIALISSVSGGSLATAFHIERQYHELHNGDHPPYAVSGPWQHSIQGEVFHRMVAEAEDLRQRATAEYDRQLGEINAIVAELNQAASRGEPFDQQRHDNAQALLVRYQRMLSPYPQAKQLAEALLAGSRGETVSGAAADAELVRWLPQSQFVDVMCTDFMAPLLRGAYTVGTERGEYVSRYWEQQFGWRGHSTLGGYAGNGYLFRRPGEQTDRTVPLVLFNTCNVAHGNRLVVGFPPLPPGLLGGPIQPRDPRPEYSALALTDFHPRYELRLSEAVRLSANFPYGFGVARLLRTEEPSRARLPRLSYEDETEPLTARLPAAATESLNVLDGGIVDNTGVYSLVQLLRRLYTVANPDQVNEFEAHLRQSVAIDQSTRNQLVERARRVQQRACLIQELLKERDLVLVEIDSGKKPETPRPLAAVLPALAEPRTALERASYANAVFAKEKILEDLLDEASGPDVPYISARVEFVCNRSRDVMTAWALGPKDKAVILVQFLLGVEDALSQLKQQFPVSARVEPAAPAVDYDAKLLKERIMQQRKD